MSPMPTLKRRNAVKEVRVHTRTGGNITNTEVTDTTTAGIDSMAEVKVAEPTAMTHSTAQRERGCTWAPRESTPTHPPPRRKETSVQS